MKHLTKLASVLRYVGLNLNPVILEVVLALNDKIKDNPKLSLEEIDTVVAEIEAKNAPKEQAVTAPELQKA